MSDLNPYEESLAVDLAKANARIEELERERDEARAGNCAANEYEPTWAEAVDIWKVNSQRLEAKLTKAVEALREIAGSVPYADNPWQIALAALTELEGKE